MKCGTCKLEKSEDSFNWKNKAEGIRSSKCRDCHKLYAAEHYKNNKDKYIRSAKQSKPVAYKKSKDYILNYLSTHPCVDCGNSDIRVLQFDHIEPVGASGRRVNWYMGSINKVMAEINKCEVRCANCHMIRTFDQFGWTRSMPA